MSITLMAQVWALDIGSTDKIVLLALADHANDEGYCWPGNASLCKKCGLSERAVRLALGSLESAGHITRHFNTGKSTSYHVHPGTTCPRQDMPPAPHAETPAPRAPKPSRNINTKPSGVSRGHRLPADWQPTAVEGVNADTEHIKREAEKFKDYWVAQPGQKGVKTDWQATWRNWLRRSTERRTGYGNAPRNSQPSATDIALARLAQCEAAEPPSVGGGGIAGLLGLEASPERSAPGWG